MFVRRYRSARRRALGAILRTRVSPNDTLTPETTSAFWESRSTRRKNPLNAKRKQFETWCIRSCGGRSGEGGAVAERGGGGGEIVWWWWSVAASRPLLVLPSRRLRSTAKWCRSTALAVVVSVAVLVVVVALRRARPPRASRTIITAAATIITTTITGRSSTIMTGMEWRIAPALPPRTRATSSAVRTRMFPPAPGSPGLGNRRRRPSPRDRTCYRYTRRTTTSSIRRHSITSSWTCRLLWSMVRDASYKFKLEFVRFA